MRAIHLIPLAAVLAGSPVMAQSLLEPSTSAAQMQPGASASINQNVGAMVALRNLNAVSDALSAQQKRPDSDSRSTDAVDDGAAYSVVQGLRDDMAALKETNSRDGQGKQPGDLASRQRKADQAVQVFLNALTQEQRRAFESQADQNARKQGAPPARDPSAGADPQASAGKAPGDNLNLVIANINEAMQQLNALNQQLATSKLSREQQMQQALESLPSLLRDSVRIGLLTIEEALSFVQGVENEQSAERLPSRKTLEPADLVRAFVQTASIAGAVNTGSTGPGRNAATYISAMLQEGLTETGTEFASTERTRAAADPWSDFAYYSAGQVTPVAPTHALNGATEGTYQGRVLGAFGNGDVVNGTMTMNINFAGGEMDGGITFAGGQGTIGLLGSATGTSISGNVDLGSNTAFGGTVAGSLSGQMFGPRAEEVGGNWNFSVTGGSRDGQSASGAFAAKQ